MKNYRSVSLSQTFGNFFERLIFNSLFKYIDQSELPNLNQSRFCPLSSFTNQRLSINYEFFSYFNCDPPKEACAMFLDISKVIDKIWMSGLIFKFKSFGVSGDLLRLIENFLSNRFQRVALNRNTSGWEELMLEYHSAQF